MMTVRDLLPMAVDIDVVDDVCEELWIAFCGPIKLTEDGEKHFAEVLDYPISIVNAWDSHNIIVHVDDENEAVWQERLRRAKELFESLGGFCTQSDYDRWFQEAD